ATVGAYNLSSRPGGAPSSPVGPPKAAEAAGALSGPPPRADVADVLEALEPLLRFLNLETTPASLEELAAALGGYRVTTLIASLSDPRILTWVTTSTWRPRRSSAPSSRKATPWTGFDFPGSTPARPPAPAALRNRLSPVPHLAPVPRRTHPARPPGATRHLPPFRPPCADRAMNGSPERSCSVSTATRPGPINRPLLRSSCCFSWSVKRPPGGFSRRPS